MRVFAYVYILCYDISHTLKKGSGRRMDVPISCLIIGLCLLGHFFFSASETALSCCNRFKFQIKADEGSKTSKILLKLCDKFDQSLSVILIGNNIVAIVISAISTLLFLNIFQKTGLAGQNEVISLISSITMSIIIFIFGDSFPKTIARLIPDTVSYIVCWPIYILMILIYPITLLFKLMMKTIDKVVKVESTDDQFTEEDFENVVEKGGDAGFIDEEQSEIIQSALEFADTNVKEVLTPKEKILAVDIKTLNHETIKQLVLDSPYSRIPVYESSFDNVVGILVMKTYFNAYVHNKNIKVRKILQKPYFVSNNIMIDDIFQGFKKHHTHIALVRDKNKKIVGMVTMEDVLEELVSDISEPSVSKGKKAKVK